MIIRPFSTIHAGEKPVAMFSREDIMEAIRQWNFLPDESSPKYGELEQTVETVIADREVRRDIQDHLYFAIQETVAKIKRRSEGQC